MTRFPYYTGEIHKYGTSSPQPAPVALPPSRREEQANPRGYLPDDGLVAAVNAALLLCRPLLITGEPGTGKTQLAHAVAWELGLPSPWVFEAKSTSTARDLFYVYDTVGRFHAANIKLDNADSKNYITYNALGKALLLARPELEVRGILPDGFIHDGPRRSVVLIDEIDKAPRDFPNDLLNELDGMYFKIPELGSGIEVRAAQQFWPILILTSNSERILPDAFLRRCIYYDIPFPDTARLKDIVYVRLRHFQRDGKLLDNALDLFLELRENSDPLKKPSTAELLDWLTYLSDYHVQQDCSLRDYPQLLIDSLSVLVKNAEDQQNARRVLDDWIRRG